MNEESQDAHDKQTVMGHRLLREPLLDLLYRLESLEAALDPMYKFLTRLPSFETGAEQDAALADMAVRLSALERKLEDEV